MSGVRVIDSKTRQGRVVPGARRVPVRLDHRHHADPARHRAPNISPTDSPTARIPWAAISWTTSWDIGATGTHPGFPRSLLLRPPAHGVLPAALREHHRERRRLRARLWIPGLLGPQQLAARPERSRRRHGAQAATCERRDAGRCAGRLRRDAAARRQSRDAARAARTSGAFRWSTSIARTAKTSDAWPSAPTAMPPQMLAAAGFENIASNGPIRPPGHCVHEMGTARMGRDPATSVLNRYNQAHDVANLFVTDGSCMTSSGTVEPLADLHGAVGARGQPRRRPARVGRNLTYYGRFFGGARRPNTDRQLPKSGHQLPEPRLDFGQRKAHAGGPGGGFRDHRDPSARPDCSDLPYWPTRVPVPSLLRHATRTSRRSTGARSTSVGRRAEIKSPTDRGDNPWRIRLLVSGGLLGIVSRLLALVFRFEEIALRERTTRMPAMC